MTLDQEPGAVALEQEDDIESWLEEATPDEVRESVCMNRALLAAFDAAINEYEALRPRKTGIAMLDGEEEEDSAELEALRQRVVELRQAIAADEKKHTFVFRKGDYDEWRKIVEKHPPTEQQLERYRGLIDVNTEAAGPAMVAFSCIKPKMTVEQAERVRQSLPENVWGRLTDAAMKVNRTGTELPKSVLRTVDQLDSVPRSTTPAPAESPSASSEVVSRQKARASGRRTT